MAGAGRKGGKTPVRVSEQKRFWPRGPKGPCPGLRTAVLLTLFLLLPWVGAAPGAWASQANEGETPTVLAPQAASTTASAAEDMPPAPATPPAQAASAAAFSDAVKKGNAQALEEFLSAHPDSPEAAEARKRVAWLREDEAYERARERNDEEGYRQFIREYPKSVLRDEVEFRLKDLEGNRAREEAERRAKAEEEKRRAEVYAEAVRLDTPTAYRVFLAAYPGAPEAEEARRRMEAVQADDAAFAEAAGSEEGLRAYLDARPTGRHAGEAREKLRATKAASAQTAAPTPPAASAEAFSEASKKGSIRALEDFLSAHPDSPEAPEARKRIAWLREDEAYETARQRNDEEGYRQFIREYPKSVLRDEVELRLKDLEGRKAHAEAEQRAKAEEEKRRAGAYAEAVRLDTPTAYRVFLAAYPGAPEAGEAKRRMEAVQADDTAFAEAARSEEGLSAYLAARPKGRHADETRKALQALKSEAAEDAFREAVDLGTAEALEAFLKAHPKGPRASEARAALKARRKTEQELLKRPEAPPAISAVFSPAGPALTGRADDPVWKAAPALDVPLAGAQGPRSVRVRALHDGQNIYLQAQWSDPTPDTSSRPWVWDDARKTYAQEERLDDGLAVLLYRRVAPGEPFVLREQTLEADAWHWRAFSSQVSGLADDGLMQIGKDSFPKAASYPNPAGGQMWVREDPDGGSPGWSFYVPPGPQGAQVPSFRRAKAAGSRADVRAVGTWSSGTWTVEFARALDTYHSDDLALRERDSCAVSFGVCERAEEGRCATSPVVRLDIRGR